MTPGSRERAETQVGFSLIELQVALVVAALVALAIFGLFRAGLVLYERRVQTIAAGDAAIALEVIVRTLRESSHDPGSVRFFLEDQGDGGYGAVAVRSARTTDGFSLDEEGQPAWTRWAAFVYDARQRAVRLVMFPGVDEVPALPWDGGRVVARQVKSFTVRREADRLAVTMVLEGRGTTLTLQTAVWPRNR